MTGQLTRLPYRPTPLEVASGLIFGFGPPESLPASAEAGPPLDALERAILPALLRPPCLVGFRGDPSSSAILAVAVRLARREGLELPVPATKRFAGGRGDASGRQERVIVNLGLTDWARFDVDAELDVVGPVAMSMLRRHGLMAPFGIHCDTPLIVEASGGSFLTSVDGSEAPGLPVPSWLRPAAEHEVWGACARELASTPLFWKDRFGWLRRLRSVQISMNSLARVAASLRVQVLHPLLDAAFAAAVQGLPKTFSAQELFGELLPADLLARGDDHRSREARWNRHSRELVAAWEGEGIDLGLVDRDALGVEWSKERPDRRSFLLLQSVALAREGRSIARQLADAVGSFA